MRVVRKCVERNSIKGMEGRNGYTFSVLGVPTDLTYSVRWVKTPDGKYFNMVVNDMEQVGRTMWGTHLDPHDAICAITEWDCTYSEDEHSNRWFNYQFSFEKYDMGTNNLVNIYAELLTDDNYVICKPNYIDFSVSCGDETLHRNVTWQVYADLRLATRFHVHPGEGLWINCG
jgi:hypothetical protein